MERSEIAAGAERWIVVTGTSRGIGRATARRLAASGYRVLATVRRDEDGERLVREAPGRIESARLDLGDDASIEVLARLVDERVGGAGLAGLVNNASQGGHAVPTEYVTRAQLESAFRVDTIGTATLTAALMPPLRRAQGRVVFVGAGRLPLPPMGPGMAAKLATEALADHLRIESHALGVGVSIVYPGMTRWEDVDQQLAVYGAGIDEAIERVPSTDRARFEPLVAGVKATHRRFMATAAPADRVAATIERALTARRPRARYYCGFEQKSVAWLERLTTERVRDAVVRRISGL